MDSIKVAIVIPVYNVSKYIAHCVASVINQSYENIEIVLVDDGSKDDSVAIAEELLKKCKRTYQIIRQPNGGVSSARNNGINQASGQLVMALDADDVLRLDAIETMVEVYRQNSVQCVVCGFQLMKSGEDPFATDEKKSVWIRTGGEACEKYFNREETYVSPAMLLDKAFLQKHGIQYDEACRFAEDDLYVWHVLAKAEAIAYCEQKLYGYVFHENSTMTSATYDRFTSSYHAVKRLFDAVLCTSENVAAIREPFVFRHIFGVVHAAAKVLSYQAFRKLLEEIDYMQQYRKASLSGKLRIVGCIPRFSVWAFYIICRKK